MGGLVNNSGGELHFDPDSNDLGRLFLIKESLLNKLVDTNVKTIGTRETGCTAVRKSNGLNHDIRKLDRFAVFEFGEMARK